MSDYVMLYIILYDLTVAVNRSWHPGQRLRPRPSGHSRSGKAATAAAQMPTPALGSTPATLAGGTGAAYGHRGGSCRPRARGAYRTGIAAGRTAKPCHHYLDRCHDSTVAVARLSVLFTAATLALCVVRGAGAQAPEVQIAAVPEYPTVAPGGSFRVAVRLRIPEGWHIAWTNPGQNGLPTTVAWTAPRGISPGVTEWPYPERDEAEGQVSHIYRGEVVIVTSFHTVATAQGNVAVLHGEFRWGLCAKVCVPQTRTVEVSVPLRSGPAEASRGWRGLEADLEALPVQSAELRLHGVVHGDSVRLTIAGPAVGRLQRTTATFFPLERGAAVVVPIRAAPGTAVVTLPSRVLRSGSRQLAGILVAPPALLLTARRRALVVATVVE